MIVKSAPPPPPPPPPGLLTRALAFLQGRRIAPAPPPVRRVPTPMAVAAPAAAPVESSLDLGVLQIRRTDPRFDPSRFAGYAAMVFRDAHHAWMARDVRPLRDRLTPHMYDELQARCERLRSLGRVYRVAEIEIKVEVIEAWQEQERDYLTAYIGGEIVDETTDEVNAPLAERSRAVRAVEEFWTFARPAGLNFWMLSAIQTS